MKKKIIPPEISVPGATEFEKFCNLTREVLAVPKAVIDRREAEWKEKRTEKKSHKSA